MLTALSDLTILAAGLPVSLAAVCGGIGGTVGVLRLPSAACLTSRTQAGVTQGAQVGVMVGAMLVLTGLLLAAIGVAVPRLS